MFSILKEKETKLQGILPKLHFSQLAKKSRVNVFEGRPAIKNMLNSFLEIGETIDVFGIPRNVISYVEHFIEPYHRRRISRGVLMRHIYNADAGERIDYLNSLEHTEAKCLPKKYDSPVSTFICGSHVSLVFWADNPIVVLIEDAKLAESYRKYFEILWRQAKL